MGVLHLTLALLTLSIISALKGTLAKSFNPDYGDSLDDYFYDLLDTSQEYYPLNRPSRGKKPRGSTTLPRNSYNHRPVHEDEPLKIHRTPRPSRRPSGYQEEYEDYYPHLPMQYYGDDSEGMAFQRPRYGGDRYRMTMDAITDEIKNDKDAVVVGNHFGLVGSTSGTGNRRLLNKELDDSAERFLAQSGGYYDPFPGQESLIDKAAGHIVPLVSTAVKYIDKDWGLGLTRDTNFEKYLQTRATPARAEPVYDDDADFIDPEFSEPGATYLGYDGLRTFPIGYSSYPTTEIIPNPYYEQYYPSSGDPSLDELIRKIELEKQITRTRTIQDYKRLEQLENHLRISKETQTKLSPQVKTNQQSTFRIRFRI